MKGFLKTTLACVLGMIIAGGFLLFLGINLIAAIATFSSEKGEIEKNSKLFLDFNGTL